MRCAASSSRRSFSASYSSFASGLTAPSASRRRSRRSTVAASASRSSPSAASSAPAASTAAARFVGFGAEPRGLDLDGGGGLGHRGELLSQLDLGGAELAELRAELGRRSGVSFAERRLEALGGDVERADEALGERDHARRARIRLERVRAVGDLRVAARGHLVELGGERAAPRLHLEEQRLGRLAGEPQLAARRVVAEALDRDRGDRRREQLLLRHDGKLGLALADDDRERAEPGGARPFEQREGGVRVVGDERRRALAERRDDGALHPRLDLEERERDALAFLRECAGGRRKSLALGERAVERPDALLEETRLLGERLALALDALVEDAARLLGRGAKPREPRLGRLAPQREPLGRAAQPVERLQRLLARARGVGELLLRDAALAEHLREPRLDALLRGGARSCDARRSRGAGRRARRGRARRCARGGARSRREASRRARPQSPAARAAGAACAPRPRRRARARPRSRHARASARLDVGAP